MAINVAQAFVQVVPTTENFLPELKKELGAPLEAEGEKSGGSFMSKFGKAAVAAAGAVGTAIGTAAGFIIKNALGEGMNLEQNLGGTEAVFGVFAENIQNKAEDAYKNMGLSASEYMQAANKVGALFQGSGASTVESLTLTEKAMQRAADVASVMGLDTSAALDAIAGAAKGNFTMMDNLGVAMNATTLEAYAAEKGMEDFSWKTASNLEKTELAMEMFLTVLSNTRAILPERRRRPCRALWAPCSRHLKTSSVIWLLVKMLRRLSWRCRRRSRIFC